MTKRFDEDLEVVGEPDALGETVPRAFRWRGARYEVATVLGHWREDAAWWGGAGLAVPQRDLWRVEARGPRAGGVYELVHEPGGWRLHRVWD